MKPSTLNKEAVWGCFGNREVLNSPSCWAELCPEHRECRLTVANEKEPDHEHLEEVPSATWRLSSTREPGASQEDWEADDWLSGLDDKDPSEVTLAKPEVSGSQSICNPPALQTKPDGSFNKIAETASTISITPAAVEPPVAPRRRGRRPAGAPALLQKIFSPTLAGAYSFSASTDPNLEQASLESLISCLDTLVSETDPATGQRRPYAEIRKRVCEIGLELNRRGGTAGEATIALRFRPVACKPRKPRDLTSDEALASNDRQVLELNWLHARHRAKLRPTNPKYRPLFGNALFDFGLASELVKITGTAAMKVNAINLSSAMQWELGVIQCEEIRLRYRSIRDALPRIRARLTDVAAKHPQIENVIDVWTDLWACKEMVGDSATAVVKLYRLMKGRQLDRSGTHKKLARMKAHLSAT